MATEIARQLGYRPLRSRPYLALILPLEGKPELRAYAGSAEDETRLWDYATASSTIRAILEILEEAA
jgi:hypothetical protein